MEHPPGLGNQWLRAANRFYAISEPGLLRMGPNRALWDLRDFEDRAEILFFPHNPKNPMNYD
jgi:hypothetical protein